MNKPLGSIRMLGLIAWGLIQLTACGTTEIGDDNSNPPIDDPNPSPPIAPITTGVELFTNQTIPTIALTLSTENLQTLNDTAIQELYVPGEASVLGENVSNIGIRYKGSYGTLESCFTNGVRNNGCAKLSLKLKFNKYVDGQRLFGLKRLNLHAMERDGSFMREVLSYEAFRENGMIAPRTSYVNITMNGENLGLYLAVETVDGRFTRSNFDDGGEGNLYKEVWPDTPEATYFTAGLKTNENEDPDVSKFVDFTNAIEQASNEDFKQTLSQYVDPEQWIRYVTLNRMVGHWDGIFAWYCSSDGTCRNHNFYWYQDTHENLLTIIPWDYDGAFFDTHLQWDAGVPSWTELNPDCGVLHQLSGVLAKAPNCDPLLRKTRATMWEEYKTLAQELLDNHFTPEKMTQRIDELIAQISDAVANDPLRTNGSWQYHQGILRSSVSEKRQIVENEITLD